MRKTKTKQLNADTAFLRWLVKQRGRNDLVGDLAEGHVLEPLRPCSTLKEVIAALRRKTHDRAVLGAGYHAWREWRSGVPTLVTRRIQRELLKHGIVSRVKVRTRRRAVVSRARAPIKVGQRFRILHRDGFKCRYCGRAAPGVVLHLDHVLPVARGGGSEDKNLVTACQDCNFGKGSRLLAQAESPKGSPRA